MVNTRLRMILVARLRYLLSLLYVVFLGVIYCREYVGTSVWQRTIYWEYCQCMGQYHIAHINKAPPRQTTEYAPVFTYRDLFWYAIWHDLAGPIPPLHVTRSVARLDELIKIKYGRSTIRAERPILTHCVVFLLAECPRVILRWTCWPRGFALATHRRARDIRAKNHPTVGVPQILLRFRREELHISPETWLRRPSCVRTDRHSYALVPKPFY